MIGMKYTDEKISNTETAAQQSAIQDQGEILKKSKRFQF